jgi:hypothetical protein
MEIPNNKHQITNKSQTPMSIDQNFGVLINLASSWAVL